MIVAEFRRGRASRSSFRMSSSEFRLRWAMRCILTRKDTYVDPAGTLNVLSLCSGIGGLDLGIRRAVPGSRVVCYVEREAFACEVLAAKIEEGSLDPAPCWTDLRTFDGKPWRGIVDLVVGGFPCQPVSHAGKRLGDADERWLWPEFLRIVRECESPLVFWENVPGILTKGFRGIASDLDRHGYRMEAPSGESTFGLFSAAEVGATHRRERVFCLAWHGSLADSQRGGRDRLHERLQSGSLASDAGDARVEHVADDDGREWRVGSVFDRLREALGHDVEGRGHGMGDASLVGRGEGRAEHAGIETSAGPGSAVADPESVSERESDDEEGSFTRRDARVDAGRGGRGIPLWPPGPDDLDSWAEVVARDLSLSPSLPQPRLLRLAHGISQRVDEIRAYGNAVVPDAAEKAFRTLAGRLFRG